MNISVVEAGRMGGLKRAANLSAEARSKIARAAQKKSVMARWRNRLTFVDLNAPRNVRLLDKSELEDLSPKEQRQYAHRVVKASMKQYAIKPGKCCLCPGTGFKRIVAHHVDYMRPFHVAFVCASCHTKLHRGCLYC